jgi:hypothetical protein
MERFPLPLVLGAGTAAALYWQWRRNATPSVAGGAPPSPDGVPMSSSRSPLASLPGRWVWPVGIWKGRKPVISSGWGTPRGLLTHEGVDVMFRRLPEDPYPIRSFNGSKGFVLPDGVLALSASDGMVWSAGWTPRGFSVVIDHGEVATYYTHMEALRVSPTTRGRSGQRVVAGQPLGVIGGDPMDTGRHLKHLHFALWRGGPRDAVDPAPLMRSWAMVADPGTPLSGSPGEPPAGGAPAGSGGGGRAPGVTSGAPLQGPITIPPRRNAAFHYRPVGERGERYPEWVRSLRGRSGVYVIRERPDDSGEDPPVVYVGQSQTGRLYETMTRHLQEWTRRKSFWRGQFSANDPGVTYPRDSVEVAVRLTAPSRALDEEARLIRALRPRDNVLGQPDDLDDTPF